MAAIADDIRSARRFLLNQEFVGPLHLLDERTSGLAGQRNIHRSKLHRSKAALFEFLSAAAGTWIVPTDALEGILNALTANTISLGLSPPPRLVFSILLGEAVPSR